MSTDLKWITGGIVALVGVLSLFMASHAGSGGLYWTGILVFAACYVAIMLMIKLAYDGKKGDRTGRDGVTE